jgi:RNA polymerase sigma factor (sigma-70 family)
VTHQQNDSVARLVARLAQGEATPSTLREADRVLRRAEPVARAACRGEARGLPADRVEELVQDALEIVWSKMPGFEAEGAPFEQWVRGIARNVCRNALRKKRDLLTEDGVIEATDPAHDVLRQLERTQRQAVLVQAIEAGLSGIEQDVLFHRYVHGLSRDQIAQILQLADADAVRVILIRARRHLKHAIVARLQDLGHSESLLRSEGG